MVDYKAQIGKVVVILLYIPALNRQGKKSTTSGNSGSAAQEYSAGLWLAPVMLLLGLVVSPGGKIRLEQNLADETNTGLLVYMWVSRSSNYEQF